MNNFECNNFAASLLQYSNYILEFARLCEINNYYNSLYIKTKIINLVSIMSDIISIYTNILRKRNNLFNR